MDSGSFDPDIFRPPISAGGIPSEAVAFPLSRGGRRDYRDLL